MLTCSPSPSLQHFYNAPPAQMLKEREATPSEMSALVDVRVAIPHRDRCGPVQPDHLRLDQLFELNAVLIAQMHRLFVLCTFLSGRLDTLHAWQKAHTDTSGSVHDRDLNRAAGS
ncbi:hypothetical protein EDB83DRAFT_2517195 [Lactarius deliciosus]|nr:hypothetical protein EDB83DRAFT_2517195 [Lactarius deliciosus]